MGETSKTTANALKKEIRDPADPAFTVTTHYGYAASNGQLTTTVTNLTAQQLRGRVTDATGALLLATDAGGILSYVHHPSGGPSSISMSGMDDPLTVIIFFPLPGKLPPLSVPNSLRQR